jgi:uncharacterized protein
MPHQCVRCNRIYEDGANELLKGCKCGSKFFLFFKKEALEEIQEEIIKLSSKEREQIEKDVFDIIDVKRDDSPVILDLESIRVLKPGKFEIDLMHLFKGEPLVYKVENGKYIIDLASTFQMKKLK